MNFRRHRSAVLVVDEAIDFVAAVIRLAGACGAVLGIVGIAVKRELGLPAHERGPQPMIVRHVEYAGDIGAVMLFLIVQGFSPRGIGVLRIMVAARPLHAAPGHHGRVIGKRYGHVVIVAGIVGPSPFDLKTPEVRQLVFLDHRLKVNGTESVDTDFDEVLAARCRCGLRGGGLRQEPAGQHQGCDERPTGNCRDSVGNQLHLLGGIGGTIGNTKVGWAGESQDRGPGGRRASLY